MSDRAGFDVPDDVVYLNTASLAPTLRAVRRAGEAALNRRARPWTIQADDWFTDVERLRALAAGLIGSRPDDVALVPSTSYGMAVAAHNLELSPGDRVLVLADEYPSGIYTWRAACEASGATMRTVERTPGSTWTNAVLEGLDDRVAVVSIPNVHWTDGSSVDLPAVAERVRAVGAKLVVDASQSLGAMPFDLDRVQPDFLVSVGYKWLLGPFGVGYLYVAPKYHDGRPIEQNWINRSGADDFARLVDYTDEYAPGARRFDVGQRTWFELIPMAIAALEQVTDWRPERIAHDLRAVTDALAEQLEPLGFAAPPRGDRAGHMIGVTLPVNAPDDLLQRLEQRGCFAGSRGSVMRLAPHLHVIDADIERFVGAIESFAA